MVFATQAVHTSIYYTFAIVNNGQDGKEYDDLSLIVLRYFTGPLLTKPTDVLPQDLVKSRSQVFSPFQSLCHWTRRRAAEMPVKFQGETNIIEAKC